MRHSSILDPTLEAKDKWERAEKTLEAANEATHTVSNLYITFLLLGTYIGIIIGSTTDEQLLRVSPVTLPLLNVELPILGFYIFVPWLFLLFHFNLLLQFYLLGRKLRVFDQLAEGMALRERERLSNFPFVHMLIGRQHDRFLWWLLALMVWITMIFLPLGLLLWAQIAFLPYHDPAITWGQRAAVVVDAGILTLLWGRIVSSQGAGGWWGQRLRRAWAWFPWLLAWPWAVIRRIFRRPWQPPPGLRTFWREGRTEASRGAGFLMTATLSTVLTSLLIATVPDEQWEQVLLNHLPESWMVEQSKRRFFKPTYVLFGVEGAFFHRNLDLREKVLTVNDLPTKVITALREGKAEQREQALQKVLGIDLQGRDLRYANLYKSILPKVDLRKAAELQGAHLDEAQLQGANLGGAQLQGADLSYAQLQGADLRKAAIGGAVFEGANLDLADLRHLNREPLTEERYQKLSKLLEGEIKDADKREYDLKRLAVGKKDTLDKAESAAQCLSGEPKLLKSCLTKEADYRKALVPYLVELACNGPNIARGVVLRASQEEVTVSLPPPLNLSPLRITTFTTVDAELATDLLEENCEPMMKLPEHFRTRLREVIGRKRMHSPAQDD